MVKNIIRFLEYFRGLQTYLVFQVLMRSGGGIEPLAFRLNLLSRQDMHPRHDTRSIIIWLLQKIRYFIFPGFEAQPALSYAYATINLTALSFF